MFHLNRQMQRLLCILGGLALLATAIPAQQARPRAGRLAPTHANLVYATVGGQPLKLDLYLPKTPSTSPLPLVIHIHGGGWAGGSKEALPPYGAQLLNLGFAMASVQYRLTSQAGQWGDAPVTFPVQIHDVKGAVRWLRAHAKEYNLDPDRFGACGESAGGHLTALLATSGGVKELEGDTGGNGEQSSRVQAGVDYFGPTDFIHLNDDITTPPGCILDHDSPTGFVGRLIAYDQPGQGVADVKKHLASTAAPYPALRHLIDLVSPVTHVDAGDPPLLIAHGTRDLLVPLKQAHRLDEALARAGVRHELVIAPGAGHGDLGVKTNRAAVAFFVETLNPAVKGKLDEIQWAGVQ